MKKIVSQYLAIGTLIFIPLSIVGMESSSVCNDHLLYEENNILRCDLFEPDSLEIKLKKRIEIIQNFIATHEIRMAQKKLIENHLRQALFNIEERCNDQRKINSNKATLICAKAHIDTAEKILGIQYVTI